MMACSTHVQALLNNPNQGGQSVSLEMGQALCIFRNKAGYLHLLEMACSN
jgi:hypothetical protein